ncbi:hypothetical protein RvY_00647-1 [Ramazzottius varieornatus]|uniref:Uncharacterized protein n=1 Tax=Ramazzottius varieornatus TaxID=947166 RepID=A0A1D1UNB3_RAMVA|nr:hypothetical protein RvY_00647-1 [Ramazzottius varieornatus]
MDDPRVRAKIARAVVNAEHDKLTQNELAAVKSSIKRPSDFFDHGQQDIVRSQPDTSHNLLEGLGGVNFPTLEVSLDLPSSTAQDLSNTAESWPCENLYPPDFITEPSFVEQTTVQEVEMELDTVVNAEEPQQAVVHCLPLPSLPEPPTIDLPFLLGSDLGTLPMAQKLKWIDHAVKRSNYFCDLYKYRKNFQKIISSWSSCIRRDCFPVAHAFSQ